MARRIGLVLFGVVLLSAPMTASAASPWADGATYSEQAVGKLKYGLKNVLLGWTSLFREPVQASQNGENVLVGIGRGVWNAAGQTVGGALHAVTFPIPQIDVPLPEGGTDVLG
ncbi:MAG: hypothetical protein HYT88_03950 [Candidatus Omnitrophica bacterium]|nr:hypothetical protein [Candidatus Omnitrophota bacterium]MBI2174724.1 hypothetical protein [Candidatus Omnitrophota bacterium]MBI3010791.1 hypothetical protein [Candidatus Omnitrophota bacterium]